MLELFRRLGQPGTWTGEGKTSRFTLKSDFPGFTCQAEQPLQYSLPQGSTLSHDSDILFANCITGRYISIEIKHRSAVTDQFKCRSYDMIHMKKQYDSRLLGIMVYVKADRGIGVRRAQTISYAFDHFFSIPPESLSNPTASDPLVGAIVNFLESTGRKA
jgi:hypothetical protein